MERAAIDACVDRRTVVSLMSRLRSSDGQANPYPIYSELRSLGDVVPAPWGGHLLTSYEVCDHVLRRNREWIVPDAAWRSLQGNAARWDNPSSVEMSKCLIGLNPPEHTRQRRPLGNMFGRAALDSLQNPIQIIVDKLLDQLQERLRDGEADFTALVSEELPAATLGHWMGLPAEDYALLNSLTHDQVYPQELVPTKNQLITADIATRGLHDYFTALIRERRRKPGGDIVSDWIRLWDGIEPDRDRVDEKVYFLVKFVVIAALETTSTLLSTMVWLLDQNPRQLAWLRAHPEYIPGAVEECLRYDAPVQVHSRVAAEETILSGVRIEKDQMVHVMIGAAHHDPARYEDPGAFDIRRSGSNLAFGGGIHYCLGAPLARLEATTLLSSLLQRFPTLRVSTPPVWAPRVAFRRLTALHVFAQ